jgi:hypothetical protein
MQSIDCFDYGCAKSLGIFISSANIGAGQIMIAFELQNWHEFAGFLMCPLYCWISYYFNYDFH